MTWVTESCRGYGDRTLWVYQYTESLEEVFGNVTSILSVFMGEDEEPKVF